MTEEQKSKEGQAFRLRKDLIQPEALQLVPETMARQYNVIPVEVKGNVLRVAMANPNDILALGTPEEVRKYVKKGFKKFRSIWGLSDGDHVNNAFKKMTKKFPVRKLEKIIKNNMVPR